MLDPLPLLSAELPGIGGRLKSVPEDFEVEEIPAYEPSGTGDFLYLWIEKRDLGAEFFVKRLARSLGIPPSEIGTAGLKDRRAVTRQWVSVPAAVAPRLATLDGDGVCVLNVSRHSNKLKPGHLRGNRFRIRVRDVSADAATLLPPLFERLTRDGLANFYGSQRFGKENETLALGLRLLQDERRASCPPANKFLRKLALSAVQSALFNQYLAARIRAGLFRRVLPGEVLAKWPFGGMFVAQDVPTEQARFDRRELVHAGPMFGRKMFPAQGAAAAREQAILASAGLTAEHFHGFRKLLQGTRRHNLVYVDDLSGCVEGADAVLTFTLPAGCYATVLLGEVMKNSGVPAGDEANETEVEP